VPDFQFWLDQQQTFGEFQQQAASSTGGVTDKDGELIAKTKGCIACHSIDGKSGIGPSWKSIAGEERVLVGGGSVIANGLYLKRSITNPNDEVVLGYAPMMPPYPLPEEELDAIVEYINSLGE
jgi:cytochrome c oxidase subunit 2